jgi:hypothetical protein
LLVVIKLLLTRGEYEIRSAVDALEYPILKIAHGAILGIGKTRRLPPGASVDCKSRRRDRNSIRAASRFRGTVLFDFPATLLPVPLPGKSCLDPFFLSRLQIERMPLDLFDDVFLLHLTFKAPEGIL